jgi:hypothetical protein
MTLEIEYLDKCNLHQACEWIIFDWKPMIALYEELIGRQVDRGCIDSYNEDMQLASTKLKVALFQGKVVATGCLDCSNERKAIQLRKAKNEIPLEEEKKLVSKIKSKEQRQIVKNITDSIELHISENKISPDIFEPSYLNIEIAFDELEKSFPAKVELSELPKSINNHAEKSGYITPYIEIMLNVIYEQKITNDNQGKKEHLKDIIAGKMAERGLDKSDNLSNAMATLIRNPESQKGKANKG